MLAGAKGGARGSWWFPVIGRVRLRVCQALVRPDRVEGAIATTLMCGAARAAPGGPTHFHALRSAMLARQRAPGKRMDVSGSGEVGERLGLSCGGRAVAYNLSV